MKNDQEPSSPVGNGQNDEEQLVQPHVVSSECRPRRDDTPLLDSTGGVLEIAVESFDEYAVFLALLTFRGRMSACFHRCVHRSPIGAHGSEKTIVSSLSFSAPLYSGQ